MRYALIILLLLGTPLGAIERNVGGQFIELVAVDSATGRPKTGDAANLTAYVSIDGDTSPDALTDTSATELSSTNAPGIYRFDLSQAETNGKNIVYSAKSSTSGIDVIPAFVTTVPPNFSIVVVGSDGLPAVNVNEWDDTDVPAQTVAGVPEVDVTHVEGTAPSAGGLLTAADIEAEAIDALEAYDPPTHNELTTAITGILTGIFTADPDDYDAAGNFAEMIMHTLKHGVEYFDTTANGDIGRTFNTADPTSGSDPTPAE